MRTLSAHLMPRNVTVIVVCPDCGSRQTQGRGNHGSNDGFTSFGEPYHDEEDGESAEGSQAPLGGPSNDRDILLEA